MRSELFEGVRDVGPATAARLLLLAVATGKKKPQGPGSGVGPFGIGSVV